MRHAAVARSSDDAHEELVDVVVRGIALDDASERISTRRSELPPY